MTAMLLLVLIGVLFGRRSPAESIPGPSAASAGEGSMEVHFLDVGQGESTLVRIPNGEGYYTMLIDTGEKKYAQGLENYLRALGVSRIDVLVNSHPHVDHMGGMAQLILNFDIGEIFAPAVPDALTPITKVYEDMLDAVMKKNMQINELCEGAYIDVPNSAKIEVYAPGKQSQSQSELNNYSGIMKLTFGGTSFLFTGDAEASLENETLQKEYDFHAMVLSCGHHGASGSTTEAFLRAVEPEYAVISCGADNPYGHPGEELLQRLGDFGCEILRTDTDKTMILCSDGTEITVETNRPSIEGHAQTTEEELENAA